jgi:hypothetical protein
MEFMRYLTFLAILTSHLSVLNFKWHGKGQNVSHLVGHIEGFHKKLNLFEDTLQKEMIQHIFHHAKN